jgi:hypothetical protein
MEARLQKAELVENYDGWVYSYEIAGYRDGYFESVAAFVEHCAGYEREEMPEFVFCCRRLSLKINLYELLEQIEYASGFDALEWEPEYCGMAEFKSACDEFVKVNADICSWHVDYSRKVQLCG